MKGDNGFDHLEQLNGSTAFVLSIRKSGESITVSGWHPAHHKFKAGERILFQEPSGETTRYEIKDVRRPGDPHDQYFMDCEFCPRTGETGETGE